MLNKYWIHLYVLLKFNHCPGDRPDSHLSPSALLSPMSDISTTSSTNKPRIVSSESIPDEAAPPPPVPPKPGQLPNKPKSPPLRNRENRTAPRAAHALPPLPIRCSQVCVQRRVLNCCTINSLMPSLLRVNSDGCNLGRRNLCYLIY